MGDLMNIRAFTTLVVLSIAVSAPRALATAVDTATDDFTRTYGAPIERVFDMAAQVAAAKWHVTHLDQDTRIIVFQTGMTMRTLRGFNMTIHFVDVGDGKTQVGLEAKRRPTTQLFSWNEGNRIAARFHDELRKRLAERRDRPDSRRPPTNVNRWKDTLVVRRARAPWRSTTRVYPRTIAFTRSTNC